MIFRDEGYDRLYVLGDIGYECIALLNPFHDRIVAVKGNCDGYEEEDFARFQLPIINYDYQLGRLIVLTHGHFYNRYNVDVQYGIFLSGHTHMSTVFRNADGSYVANPGSLGSPRDGYHSYLRIDETGMKVLDVSSGAIVHFQDF